MSTKDDIKLEDETIDETPKVETQVETDESQQAEASFDTDDEDV